MIELARMWFVTARAVVNGTGREDRREDPADQHVSCE